MFCNFKFALPIQGFRTPVLLEQLFWTINGLLCIKIEKRTSNRYILELITIL